MLVGFVSVTAGCHVIEPWAAIIAGAIGGLVFEGMCEVLLRFKVDDPLSAAPMHGFGGMWGVLFVGLLAKKVGRAAEQLAACSMHMHRWLSVGRKGQLQERRAE
jgi:ammonia channel protein AmtB